jgi:beta-mannanase
VERINKVIQEGYIPMITLEDHFVNTGAHTRQPNLYSIFEGHFDSFFGYWAHQIKDVKGTVLLRILHEFNGDWYPWCTVNNDKNPELVGRAFRYIHNIFRENHVTNVKFIWCPNSMSVPQESWNYIMDAYPGDEYVDFVGLDIYNGAGSGKGVGVWRSFRKEAIENYFTLTHLKPNKPFLVCETASRERRIGEGGQDKAEWIRQMTDALKTDMNKVRLLAWFNEKETFKVNSSGSSQGSFQQHVINDPFFRAGTKDFELLLRR